MPPLGTMKDDFPPGTTPEQQRLAESLKSIRRLLPGTLKEISKRLDITETSLGHYLRARRIPPEDVLRRTYAMAAASHGEAELGCTEEQLIELRKQALNKPPSAGVSQDQPEGGAAAATDRRTEAAGNTDPGDRPSVSAPATSPASSPGRDDRDLLTALEDLEPGTRVGVLWAVGGTLSERAAAQALLALTAAGHTDEFEVLLASLASHGRDMAELIRGLVTPPGAA